MQSPFSILDTKHLSHATSASSQPSHSHSSVDTTGGCRGAFPDMIWLTQLNYVFP